MKFEIHDIEILLSLGTTDIEQATPQKILISLFWNTDTKKAEQSDNLEDTINYFEIREFVKTFLKDKSFSLLEKLHHDLFQAVANYFPEAQELKIHIQKFPFENGSVVISNE
jgi:7,8-dihydroneopterin aldolase/epimerase/oxygenase